MPSKGLIYSGVFSSMGALLFGLDNGWWALVLGLPQFNTAFGVDIGGTIRLSSTQQSVGTSMQSAGVMIGSVCAIPLDKRGRKVGIVVMCAVSLVGILIEFTASFNGYRYWQLVSGKLIKSVSMGIAANVIPTYNTEIAPTRWRGAIINLYQCIQVIGVILVSLAIFLCRNKPGALSWQLCIGLQLFPVIFLLGGISFLPESPRYLLFNGNPIAARQSLDMLYVTPNTTTSEIDHEFLLLEEAMRAEKVRKNDRLFRTQKNRAQRIADGEGVLKRAKGIMSDYFFVNKSDARRMMIAVGMQCLQQAQGSGYMTNYLLLFLYSLNIMNPYPFIIGLYVLYLIGTVFSFFLPDMVGRRPIMLSTAAICGLAMLSISLLNTIGSFEGGIRSGSLGLVFIWYFFFGLGWSPLVWITCSEVCSTRAREITLATAVFSGFGTGLVISLVSPYIQNPEHGNLGAKIGFLWAGFTLISIPFVYFFVPEMKGLSLEKLDALFEAKTPTLDFPKASKDISTLPEQKYNQF